MVVCVGWSGKGGTAATLSVWRQQEMICVCWCLEAHRVGQNVDATLHNSATEH